MRRNIGIVGAGISGLACARTLTGGPSVTLFDKGRGFGGRLSSRRAEGAGGEPFLFDHGAAVVDVAGARFREAVDRVVRAGRAGWVGAGTARGEPSMHELVRGLAGEAPVRFGVTVARLDATEEGVWMLGADGEPLGRFDRVVVTVPAPQAAALVTSVDADLARRTAAVEYEPRWVAMLGVQAAAGPRLTRDGDGRVIEALVHRGGGAWTAHATRLWSAQHLEADAPEALRILQAAASRLDERLAHPEYAAAHRWRYARVSRSIGEPLACSACGRVLVCGDGFGGVDAAGAYASGTAAAEWLT